MTLPNPFAILARTPGRGARLDLRLRTLADLLFSVGGSLDEVAGEAVADRVMVESAQQTGRKHGERYARDFGVTGRNAISSSAPAIIALETYEARYEARAKPRNLELRITSCPLREMARESGPAAEASCCAGCGGYLQGLVQAVNPQARSDMPERMGWGDAACRFTVSVSRIEPGPSGLDVPRDVQFMPTTQRRRLLIDALADTLTAASKAGATLDRQLLARVMSRAAQPAGQRTAHRVRTTFGIEGRELPDAVLAARLHADVAGVGAELGEEAADRAAWRTNGCVVTGRDGAPEFACTACRHFHEGLLQAGEPDVEVTVADRVLDGAAGCGFHARRVPATEQLRRTGRGWVDAGLTRVALIDSASTYYSIWTLLGETLEHVGRRAAGDIARREVRTRGLAKDEEGFAAVVESLVQSGYGGLHVLEAELGAPRALVVCADSFEADAVRANGGSKEPTCHLLRGLLAGLLEEMSGERNLSCVETSCAGRGDARCEFLITTPRGD